MKLAVVDPIDLHTKRFYGMTMVLNKFKRNAYQKHLHLHFRDRSRDLMFDGVLNRILFFKVMFANDVLLKIILNCSEKNDQRGQRGS